jgi:hypothetical protein
MTAPATGGTDRARDAARVSAKIGLYIAAVTFAGVALSVATGRSPALFLVESPALGFAIYFAAAFLLLITGAVRVDGRQMLVNPWFAWMAIGAIVVFLVTLMILGHPVIMPPHVVEWSVAAAVGWVVLVVMVWAIARAFGHRLVAPVAGTPPQVGVDLAHPRAGVQRNEDRFVGGALLFMAVMVIGSTIWTSGPWHSTQTRLVLLSAVAGWWGITKLTRASRD